MKPKVNIIITHIEDQTEYRLSYITPKGKKIERSSMIYTQPEQLSYFTDLAALNEALGRLNRPCTLAIYAQNPYIVESIRMRLEAWKRNGWKGARGNNIKNEETWKEIYDKIKVHDYKVDYLSRLEEGK